MSSQQVSRRGNLIPKPLLSGLRLSCVERFGRAVKEGNIHSLAIDSSGLLLRLRPVRMEPVVAQAIWEISRRYPLRR